MLRILLPIILAALSIAGSGEVIQACVDEDDGTLRVVASDQSCEDYEYALQWGITGPQGPQGPPGVVDINCSTNQIIVWDDASGDWVCSDDLALLNDQTAELYRRAALLNRNSAAVTKFDMSGSETPGGTYSSLIYRFGVCTEAEHLADSQCNRYLELNFTNADQGNNFIFDGQNASPELEEIIDLLTNGQDDIVELTMIPTPGGGAGRGWGSESDHFIDFLAPRAVDLQGFDIERISITLDYYSLFNGSTTSYDFEGRQFFELAGTDTP